MEKNYSDLDFVIDELGQLFSDKVKKAPLQNLCNNARDFIRVYYNGNYPKFAYLVSYATCAIIVDDDDKVLDNPIHLTDDGLGVIISLFTDKKNFPKQLFESMQLNTKFGSDDDEYGSGQEDDGIAPSDAFETIIGQIVVSIASIMDQISDLLKSLSINRLPNKGILFT